MPYKKKKHILYVESNIDGTIGGSYFSLLFLIEGLDKEKYSPTVVFYRTNELMNRYRNAGCKIIIFKKPLPIKVYFFENRQSKNKLSSFIYSLLSPLTTVLVKALNFLRLFIFPALKCLSILLIERIDLIHLNNTLLRPQEWMLASLLHYSKVIAHERGINDFFPISARFFSRRMKAIICISNAVKRNLEKHKIDPQKLILIYNGLDPLKFIPQKDPLKLRKDLCISSSTPLIGVVGNIKYWKGQETMVRAMKKILQSVPEVKCLLIGGSTERDKGYLEHLKAIIQEDHIEDSVIFTRVRKDVPDLINILDILIHTSILPEPFGRVILEGMALKKPVITPNIGGGPEIVVNGKTGLVVQPSNPDILADSVIELLREPAKAIQMGKAGRERLEKRFHIKQNIIKTLDLYDKILLHK